MAVYTPVSEAQLKGFLAAYDVGELVDFTGITQGVENTNYLVRTSDARLILTLYEKRVSEADLPFFVGLMEHLARSGVSCPTPYRTRDGQHIGRLADRPAAIVSFLDGRAIEAPDADACFRAGAAMAKLHEAGRDFQIARTNALGAHAWAALFARFSDECDAISSGLAAEIDCQLSDITARWPTSLPSGVIHADMFPDNVFFDGTGNVSGIIDFYFACQDALAYDLAIGINAWCFDDQSRFDATRSQALVAGYESLRALNSDEAEALPVLCRGAALRFLLTRAYDWLNTDANAQVRPHDPLPFLERLRVHAGLQSAADYGVAGA
jgi:homoserine kinase type II